MSLAVRNFIGEKGGWRRVGRSGLENYSSWPITRPIQGGILNGSNKGVLCCSIKFNSGDRWRLMDVHERERERGSCSFLISRIIEGPSNVVENVF